ncbi:carotenoid oxygenase family protein [Nonomuraea africana]|uniref:carotenoid oxygenase family protein n=1 Tax=Nonomuraea africana TaxID=46171 RepID=UPI00340FE38D
MTLDKMSTDLAKPYLTGHYEPVVDETTARDLVVHGSIPPELEGRYFRNGHNPKPGITPTHWFKGTGMIHGIRLSGGRAEWYRNRWVRTPYLEGIPFTGTELDVSAAGTNIIQHGGRYLALQEANLPWEVTADLDTVGPYDFGGKLATAMTAHPKEDPVTGELFFYGYSPFPPYLTFYVASPDGQITRAEVIDGAGPSLMHDFAITADHVIWLDLPVVFDSAERSGIPYRWSDAYRPRIGVMPRTGPASVTWFDVEPGALLHVSNAYTDPGGRVVVEGPRYDRSAWESSWKWWIGAPGHGTTPEAGSIHHRWILDPATGQAIEEPLDALVTEFPTINETYLGRSSRYSYAVAFPGSGLDQFAVVKYDARTGERRLQPFGPEQMPGEAVFVPAEGGTAEDDGYLLTIMSDLRRNASQLLILDARGLGRAPVAVVELPRRVPAGIHGNWLPDNH